MSKTAAQIIDRVRRRADQENSSFVTDDEIRDYINYSLGELYDLLIVAYDSESFLDGYSFNTVSGTSDYQLPTDFHTLAGVDVESGSNTYTVKKYNFNERNVKRNSNNNYYWCPDFEYRIYGNSLRLLPVPTSAKAITIHYIPQLTELVLDTDTISNVFVESWIEYVIIDAAIKILIKEESDIQPLLIQKAAQVDRINKLKDNRDMGPGQTTTDIYANNLEWDYIY